MWNCWSLLARGRVFGVVRMRMIVLLIWVSFFFFVSFALKQRRELNIHLLDKDTEGCPNVIPGNYFDCE